MPGAEYKSHSTQVPETANASVEGGVGFGTPWPLPLETPAFRQRDGKSPTFCRFVRNVLLACAGACGVELYSSIHASSISCAAIELTCSWAVCAASLWFWKYEAKNITLKGTVAPMCGLSKEKYSLVW